MGKPNSLSHFQHILDDEQLSFDLKLEQQLHQLLSRSDYSISFAESLTGGLLSERITRQPGSADYFKGSIIAYHPQIKTKLCKVSTQTIRQHGIVSDAVALEMAAGVQSLFKTSLAISCTGFASHHPSIPSDKVGLVCIGFCFNAQQKVQQYTFEGDRHEIRQKTVQAAFMTLKIWLQEKAL